MQRASERAPNYKTRFGRFWFFFAVVSVFARYAESPERFIVFHTHTHTHTHIEEQLFACFA